MMAWQVAVGVQQHFNDLELLIRTLGMTLLTTILGGAALALKESYSVSIVGAHLPLAAVILGLGSLLWAAFYFVDQVWYHRLLVGAFATARSLRR